MKTRLFGFLVFLAVLIAWVVVCDGATIPGTIVAAKITAGDTGSTYSIGDTAEMQGTMKQVPDVATRDLISAARRTEGMFCYVTGETNLYALVGGVANANWMLWASGTNAVFTQTNISWTAITNVDQIQIPYAAITNAPAAFTQTNISWVDVTNLQSSQMPYTVITNAPWATTNYVNNATNAIYQAGTNYANSATNSIYQAGTNYANTVTNGLSPLPANAGGALTNNGAGVLGWDNGIARQGGTNTFSGNNVFSATNFMSANFTQATNNNPVVPDFSIPEQCFSTNAAFTFLAPSGVDLTAKTVQWTAVNVTNTTAAAVLATAPANTHAVGTMYVTNWTVFWFQTYGGKITNCFAVPVF